MSEFCHCDQILVNNFNRTRGSERSLPRAGTTDSGLAEAELCDMGVCGEATQIIAAGGAERRYTEKGLGETIPQVTL